MEIIHLVLGKANPERMNGVNKVVHELATVQTEQKQAVQVWGITKNPIHDYPSRTFRTVLFSAYRNPFKLDKNLKKAFADNKRKIVVHIHGAFVPVFFSAAKFLHQSGIPFILTPHSSYNVFMMKKNKWIKKIYFILFEKKLLKYTSQIHLVGKSELAGLENIYPNSKSLLIPYGFKIAEQNSIKSNRINKHFIIGYCGRIDIVSKGLDILLKGFAAFYHINKNSRLLIIGDGKEKNILEKLAFDLNVQNAVEFTGSKYGDEKIALLESLSVFVHPSRTEGLPASLMEACALGIPCVISEETNLGEWILKFKAGTVMNKTNEQGFIEGLQELYNKITEKNEEKILKNNAVSMIENAFNWTKVIKQFDKMYLEAGHQLYTTRS